MCASATSEAETPPSTLCTSMNSGMPTPFVGSPDPTTVYRDEQARWISARTSPVLLVGRARRELTRRREERRGCGGRAPCGCTEYRPAPRGARLGLDRAGGVDAL